MDACSIFLMVIAGIFSAVKFLPKIIRPLIVQRRMAKWNNIPQGRLILHGFPRGRQIPNVSPFVLKLEAFLRLAKIFYEFDDTTPLGPKGRSPWISLNGAHIGDSQLALEFLSREFNVNVNKSYSEEQIAVGSAVRIMLEEYFLWGFILERTGPGIKHIHKVGKIPKVALLIFRFIMRSRSKAQGIGLHSKDEIKDIMSQILRNVSAILGSKKFILGDEMAEVDCTVFAFMAQVLWALPESPYEKLVKGELKNIEAYCLRVKEKLWPGQEWDNSLSD